MRVDIIRKCDREDRLRNKAEAKRARRLAKSTARKQQQEKKSCQMS